jgi:DNA polymerase-3 subunit epsilon
MREIVLDTETTGLDPAKGDRLVEIGAVETIDKVATGRTYHVLINPERDVPEEAFRVHGHSTEFLKDKPVFAAVVEEFLAFIGDDPLVIHNAEFDTRFLNAELARLDRPALAGERIVDTLAIARRKHPGASNTLDALCDRYRIDRSRRVKHGALLDAEILVEVYCELSGGRQRRLGLGPASSSPVAAAVATTASRQARPARPRPVPLPARLDAEAERAHRAHLESLGSAIWLKYLPPDEAAKS